MNNKCVLLLNAEYVQSIALGKSFQKEGWRVVCFCSGKCTSGYASKYLDERYVVPNVKTERVRFEKVLISYLTNHKVSLIIPMIDDSAEYLSKNKDRIESSFNTLCAVERWEIFDLARNKQTLMELCRDHCIPHPRTTAITLDNIKDASKYIGFPAVIKPNISAGARGITLVDSYEALLEFLPSIINQYGSCTLQQYVNQPKHYYNVMMYRNKEGCILGEAVIKIRRFFPIKGGTSCYAETVKMDSLCSDCKKVLNILNWHGFADFDILEDELTKELKIIEINPRVPSSLQGAVAAGVDFARFIISDLFGGMSPDVCYKEGQQVRWFGLDVLWFVFSKDRFRFKPSWFRFWGKNVSYCDGSWGNPLPMLAGCLSGFLKYLDPNVRKVKLGH